MTDNNYVTGMMFPTQKGMPAGNHRYSAIQNMNSSQQNAALASKLLNGETKMGGSKRRGSKRSGSKRSKKGGNPDWVWGCLSGGKNRTRKHTRRTRKNRHSRKH
jgi:hypothetical protein